MIRFLRLFPQFRALESDRDTLAAEVARLRADLRAAESALENEILESLEEYPE